MSIYDVGKELRVDCNRSTLLLNIYCEYNIRRATDNWKKGVSIGFRMMMRNADDTTLLVTSEVPLIYFISKVEEVNRVEELRNKKSRTKTMKIDTPSNNRSD